MDNNEVFKNILNITGLTRDIDLVIHIFKLGGQVEVSHSKIRGWRDTETQRGADMPDGALNNFFQGMFKYRDIKRAEGINVFNFPCNIEKVK